MSLTIYGSSRSRTMRTLWIAEELGLAYTHVPVAFDDPALKEAEFLRINPAGAIPAIVDDGFALSELLAINLYLAKKYGSTGATPLYPGSDQGEADAWRWTIWAQGHLEPWVQRDVLRAELRAATERPAQAVVHAALTTLNGALSERSWLVESHFTVGDLNVAAVLSPSRTEHLDLDPFGHIRGWLARCYGRPAALRVRQRFSS